MRSRADKEDLCLWFPWQQCAYRGVCPGQLLRAGSVGTVQGHWYHARLSSLPVSRVSLPPPARPVPASHRSSSRASFLGNFSFILKISTTLFES